MSTELKYNLLGIFQDKEKSFRTYLSQALALPEVKRAATKLPGSRRFGDVTSKHGG